MSAAGSAERLVAKVPADLRARPQWVVWRLERRNGNPTKVPYSPGAGSVRASSVDATSWGTFESAIAAMENADGIGYVFADDDPYCGVDLDNCVVDGELHPAARKLVKAFDSYVELSPSRSGVHVIVRARLNGTRKRTAVTEWGGQFEVYDRERFFTVTGDRRFGMKIVAAQATLDRVVAELLPPRAGFNGGASAPRAPLDLDDQQLLDRARASATGPDFDRLWRGDLEGYDSASEAALALCNHLAFWTGGDEGRIDRLFRRSALMRDKWDARRGESTWGAQTIERSLEERTDFYEPRGRAAGPTPVDNATIEPDAAKSTLTPFTEVVAKPVRFAWADRIALAKITGLAGRPKVGKGLLYSHLIAAVTRGELDGDLRGEPRNAILVTTEDEPGDTLKPRLMAAGADLERVFIFQMGSRDEPVPFRVPQDADELARRVDETSAALVVIDPLLEFLDGKVDSHKSHPVRQAVAALNNIARESSCAALVIFHLNKGASTDPLLRHEGSAAFTQVVRGGLMLGHDPDDDDEDGNQRVLAVSSSNLAALAPSLAYRIETRIVAGDAGEAITTARMVHTGESLANGYDLLGPRDDEARSGADEAADFLLEELATGAKAATVVQQAAREAGISDKELRNGRKKLGIKPQKTGFDGGWEWALPEDALGGVAPSQEQREGHLRGNPLPERDSAGPNVRNFSQDALSITRASSGDSGLGEAEKLAKLERLQQRLADNEAGGS